MQMLGRDTGDLRMPLTRLSLRRTREAAEDARGLRAAVWDKIRSTRISPALHEHALRSYSLRICHAQRGRAVDALDAWRHRPGRLSGSRRRAAKRAVGRVPCTVRVSRSCRSSFAMPKECDSRLDELRRRLGRDSPAAPPRPAPRQQPGHGAVIGPRGRGVGAAEPFPPPRHRDPEPASDRRSQLPRSPAGGLRGDAAVPRCPGAGCREDVRSA